MSLTQEQIESEALRSITLYREAEKLQNAASGTIKIMFVFLILGIFFPPCLVIALICFALYYFGNKKAKAHMAEVHLIESVPEVHAHLMAIAEGNKAQG